MINTTCSDALEGLSKEECSELLTLLHKLGQNVNEDWKKVKGENKR